MTWLSLWGNRVRSRWPQHSKSIPDVLNIHQRARASRGCANAILAVVSNRLKHPAPDANDELLWAERELLNEQRARMNDFLDGAQDARRRAIRSGDGAALALAEDSISQIQRLKDDQREIREIQREATAWYEQLKYNRASSAQARQLMIATWVLAVATVGLIVATVWPS